MGTLIFEHLTLIEPASDSTGSLGGPVGSRLFRSRRLLATAGDGEALLHNSLTVRGLGNMLQRVPVSTLRQIRRAAAFKHEAVASKLMAKDADWAAAARPSNHCGSVFEGLAQSRLDGRLLVVGSLEAPSASMNTRVAPRKCGWKVLTSSGSAKVKEINIELATAPGARRTMGPCARHHPCTLSRTRGCPRPVSFEGTLSVASTDD